MSELPWSKAPVVNVLLTGKQRRGGGGGGGGGAGGNLLHRPVWQRTSPLS